MHHTASYSSLRQPVRDLLRQARYRDALVMLSDMRRSVGTDLAMMTDMADCLWGLGEGEPARELITAATDLNPDIAPLWTKLGGMCLALGDKWAASDAFEHAYKLAPNSCPVLSNLDRIHHFERHSQRARRLKALAERKSLPSRDRAIAWNALGRIEDRADRPGPAFRCFAKANTLNAGTYDSDLFSDLVHGLEHRFTGPVSHSDQEQISPRMVFVTGMPRSGTTLVETILTRHSQVASIGESPVLQDVLNLLRREVAQTTGDLGPWNWTDHLTEDRAADLRGRLSHMLAQRLSDAAGPVIIDKLPLNIFDLGFAQAILPQARFVFVDRHPLDVGLSNFTTNFGDKHPYSQKLTTIAEVTRAVHKAVRIYENRGLELKRLSYRALVENPGQTIHALLDFAGLPWEDSCLSPDAGVGIVRTASVTQVRDPINRKGLDRWKAYRAQLPSLINALGPEWISEWETHDAVFGDSLQLGGENPEDRYPDIKQAV